MADNVALTSAQVKGITALLQETSVERAAEQAEVSRTTFYRWMRDPLFVQTLREAEAAAVAGVVRTLAVRSSEALDTIYEVMTDQANNPALRLKAADTWLQHMLKIRDAVELEARIAALEALAKEQNNV